MTSTVDAARDLVASVSQAQRARALRNSGDDTLRITVPIPELAALIRSVEGLDRPSTSAGALGGNRTFKGTPPERHLRDVLRPALRDAPQIGVADWQIIQEVADVLSDSLRGHRSRVLERAIAAVVEEVVALSEDEVRARDAEESAAVRARREASA